LNSQILLYQFCWWYILLHFFISFIVLFSFRISAWFCIMISISLWIFSFCSCIISLKSLYYLCSLEIHWASLKQLFYSFCLVVRGFDLRASWLPDRCSTWDTPTALSCNGFFRDKVSRSICPGWLRMAILLISAFQVARVTDVSHWYPAKMIILNSLLVS
jgi:hypothetical protein